MSISHICTELPVAIIGVYGIGSNTSYPHIHRLLLHADTVLQTYALIECLERDVFDERDPIYLYVACLCTELDRFCPLTPYDRAY